MFVSNILGFTLALLVGILLFIEIGRRLGRHKTLGGEPKGIGPLEAGVFSLLGLLIAFTFGGATGRWETRRALIVEETNAIGTAYLRLDLLTPDDRARLQGIFKEYVRARLEVYRLLPDEEAAKRELVHVGELQNTIWTDVLASSRKDSSGIATRLLLPSVNDMIDITTTRTMAARAHPPKIIFILLFVLALAAALIAGYGMAVEQRRRWLHPVGYALMMTGAMYVILEIEYPRNGLVRLDTVDQALIELVESWK